jgi:hypothetical protein
MGDDDNIVWYDFEEGREVKPSPPELVAYVDEQDEVLGDSSIRHTEMPEPPWPAQDNPMLTYLLERAARIALDDNVSNALTWLATHAWFEGHLDGLATLFREISAETDR